ncbi:hypothetical protein C8F04DRAFT_285916 [Mycena alexandri]|uniref:DUF2306 domain-containing protein n=1 Tax=Mycena alexandri TaxID=1745969 RepID=A0AAD6S451_9AGAR|nr:hypothetical protein C8F04DRAFT_285916 [Mycena alexandri]
MNPARTASLLPPGEWFWLGQLKYKVNLFIHIYLSTLGGIGALFQFLPAIRRKKMILHRLNGYGVLSCLIVGNICGAIVARRSFGGELNVQSAYYALGLMIVLSGSIGLFYVKKDTRRHRKWMLRMVVYFASAISGRLIMFAAASIITRIGTYYSIWRCDEVINLLGDSAVLQSPHPRCAAAGADLASVWVAVHSSVHDGPLYYASALRATHGMGLWIALLMHVVAVEFYIQETNATNRVRVNYALEPLNLNEELPPTH